MRNPYYEKEKIDEKMKSFSEKTETKERTEIQNFVIGAFLDEDFIRYKYKQFLNNPTRNGNHRAIHSAWLEEKYIDKYIDVLLECMKKYDPQKYDSFYKYFFMSLSRRSIDLLRSRSNTDGSTNESIYTEEGGIRTDISSFKEDYIPDLDTANQILILYAIAFINLEKGLAERRVLKDESITKQSNRLPFYRVFYTNIAAEYITHATDISHISLLDRHSREVFMAADTDFIDSFMDGICRSIMEMYNSKTKFAEAFSEALDFTYDGEIDSEGRCVLPFADKVLEAFFRKIGTSVSLSKISEFRKDYRTTLYNRVAVDRRNDETEIFMRDNDAV